MKKFDVEKPKFSELIFLKVITNYMQKHFDKYYFHTGHNNNNIKIMKHLNILWGEKSVHFNATEQQHHQQHVQYKGTLMIHDNVLCSCVYRTKYTVTAVTWWVGTNWLVNTNHYHMRPQANAQFTSTNNNLIHNDKGNIEVTQMKFFKFSCYFIII